MMLHSLGVSACGRRAGPSLVGLVVNGMENDACLHSLFVNWFMQVLCLTSEQQLTCILPYSSNLNTYSHITSNHHSVTHSSLSCDIIDDCSETQL